VIDSPGDKQSIRKPLSSSGHGSDDSVLANSLSQQISHLRQRVWLMRQNDKSHNQLKCMSTEHFPRIMEAFCNHAATSRSAERFGANERDKIVEDLDPDNRRIGPPGEYR